MINYFARTDYQHLKDKKLCDSDGDHRRGFRNAVSDNGKISSQVYPHPDDETKR